MDKLQALTKKLIYKTAYINGLPVRAYFKVENAQDYNGGLISLYSLTLYKDDFDTLGVPLCFDTPRLLSVNYESVNYSVSSIEYLPNKRLKLNLINEGFISG